MCWTPGLVVLLLDGLNCAQCEVQNVKRWFLLLALLNSVMNPIIYSYKDDEMSSTMRRMICCLIEEKNQERRSSRIPSTVLSRSIDSSSQYLENGITQGTICSKASTWAILLLSLSGGLWQWQASSESAETTEPWNQRRICSLCTKSPISELLHILVNNCQILGGGEGNLKR